jgi:two-component system response regulator
MTENLGANKQDLPLNILLVDDNEADVKITVRAFKQIKWRNNLFVVTNGQECLDFLRHNGTYQERDKFPLPDIILLDINMPVMDGFQVLTALKADEQLHPIPVIMLSASNNEQDVLRSYSLGASSFIQKPVAYEDFVKVVEGFTFYWRMLNRLPRRKP